MVLVLLLLVLVNVGFRTAILMVHLTCFTKTTPIIVVVVVCRRRHRGFPKEERRCEEKRVWYKREWMRFHVFPSSFVHASSAPQTSCAFTCYYSTFCFHPDNDAGAYTPQNDETKRDHYSNIDSRVTVFYDSQTEHSFQR